MFSRSKQPVTNEQLDRIGQALVRAAADNDDAAETAATAPFLYTRLRARITERTRQGDADEGWLALLTIARRVVPALTAVTALVFALVLWLASAGGAPTPSGFGDEAFFDARESGVVQTVLTDSNNLSRDDVLNIVVSREGPSRR